LLVGGKWGGRQERPQTDIVPEGGRGSHGRLKKKKTEPKGGEPKERNASHQKVRSVERGKIRR